MFSSKEYIVSDISSKKIKDSDGEIFLAIKATIKNLSDDAGVSVNIQGVDEDGFEISIINLSGEIPVGDRKILTASRHVDKKLLQHITEWRKQ